MTEPVKAGELIARLNDPPVTMSQEGAIEWDGEAVYCVRNGVRERVEDALEAAHRELSEQRARVIEELTLLRAVMTQARTTLLVSIKGTPDELGASLGVLNLACKAHWDYETTRIRALPPDSASDTLGKRGEPHTVNTAAADMVLVPKSSPVARLHNLCKGLEEQKHDSPYSAESWDRLTTENDDLRKRERDATALLRETITKIRDESGSDDPMASFAYDHSWEQWAIKVDTMLTAVDRQRGEP